MTTCQPQEMWYKEHRDAFAGPLAQLAEQLTLNQLVTGSSPVRVTGLSYESGVGMAQVTMVTWAFAPEWLSLEEAAQLSGHSEALLLELIQDGALEAEPGAGGWKIEKASLREFQEALFDLYTSG